MLLTKFKEYCIQLNSTRYLQFAVNTLSECIIISKPSTKDMMTHSKFNTNINTYKLTSLSLFKKESHFSDKFCSTFMSCLTSFSLCFELEGFATSSACQIKLSQC